MLRRILGAALFALTLAAALAASVAEQDANEEAKLPCHRGVYILVARGSELPQRGPPFYGQGDLYKVSQAIKRRIPHSKDHAIVYPADLGSYGSSEAQGVYKMKRAVERYVDRCPKGRVVLMGYSQGAQVVADVLCGTVINQGKYHHDPITSKYAKHISSAILMGDPSHQIRMGWNANNTRAAHSHGLVSRTKLEYCSRFYKRAISFCDKGDAFCQTNTKTRGGVHGSYVERYGDWATRFVVKHAR